MGVKQSKRSVDITETSTKGEIEGFGNEGKVEKIIDGIIEKVGANGHVEGDLQNGIEPLQNGVESIQNGEAAPVVKKINDESPPEVNAQLENGEMNGEAEKIDDTKKSDDKKENEKKVKGVKKKFSIRYFSFSRKDKSKPPKEEKSPGKADETPAEEALTSPENDGQTSGTPENPANVEIHTEAPEPTKPESEAAPALEKIPEISSKTSAGVEDLPPPLPASPPPSEPIEGKIVSEMDKLDLSEPASENPSAEMTEVASSISSILTEKTETMIEVMKDVDQMAMETGKQIEEKATNLLKTVEERAEETMRTGGEMMTKKVEEIQEMCQNELGMAVEKVEVKEEMKEILDEAKKLEEGVPVEISSLGSLSPKTEEQTDKHEEGAGESLADMPKDLTDEATATSVEDSNPDSLEVPPPPPPVVDAVTGE